MTRERAYVWLVAGVRTGVATELRHSSRAPPCRGGLVLSDVLVAKWTVVRPVARVPRPRGGGIPLTS